MATRRTHSLEFKQSAVEASRQPGASIAGVAMAHGINDYIFIDGYERVRKAKLEQDRLKNIDLILPVIERKRPGNAVLN